MNRGEKKRVLEELKDNLKNVESKNLIFVNFKDVKGNEISELRKSLKSDNILYKVVKTNLLQIAVRDLGLSVDESIFKGPAAIAINDGEASILAKKFADLKDAQDNQLFDIKGGLIGNRWYSGAEVIEISKLPPRDVILGKLLYLMNSPLRRLVTVLKKPENDFVSVLSQIKDKKEQLAQSA
ncbi:MAG: 50S ribosomal protein L10 [Caldiserica bacterium]|nr:50S ribosomal protein L10 [Caldisericota bacterium]